MNYLDDYISYISDVRRYSPLTCRNYRESLTTFFEWLSATSGITLSDSDSLQSSRQSSYPESSPFSGTLSTDLTSRQSSSPNTSPFSENASTDSTSYQSSDKNGIPTAGIADLLTMQTLRSYEVFLLDDRKQSPRTVNLQLSILSGFCKYLTMRGILHSNPVHLVRRPKTEKRLPVFFRQESMDEYMSRTDYYVSEEFVSILCQTRNKSDYHRMLSRIIVEILYCTGIRRAELISLNVNSFDRSRSVLHVLGKGDKMREIPIIASLYQDISLYLIAVSSLVAVAPSSEMPLLMTFEGRRLYPVFVDRVIKNEMSGVEGVTGRKSPHVLRHTLASELLGDGADINSIKELLGHSSLAATQVYTHSSIEHLQSVYKNAHPRAKNGGKNGD